MAAHGAALGNVLFVVIDQIRADLLRGRLAGAVPTPHLDRLMAQSTVFERHFTNAVPCGPSRASLLTGQYAFNHRSIRNGTPLAAHRPALGLELRALGIEPLLFGYSDTSADPTGLAAADPDRATYEGVAPGFRELVEMRFESCLEWRGYLRRRGYALPDSLADLYRPVGPRLSDPALYRAEDSDTAYLTDATLEALEGRRGRPWFAHVTYIRPHPPLVAPAPWNRLVDPAEVPPPVAAGTPHPFRQAWHSAPTAFSLFAGFDGDCAGLDPATVAELRAVYLGLAAEVDHHLGRLLEWLDATGQRDDTLVIVTGDHGEMLGDQGMWGKESVFSPAHHVPLIVRDPRGGAARRHDGLTEAVDLAPTILAWLGGGAPPAMDGRSLLPLLRGGEDPGRRGLALTELDLSHPQRPTRFQRAWGLAEQRCNAAILRDRRWTLVHLNGGVAPLLFDRDADPDERHDLAGDPAAQGELLRLTRALVDLHLERADRSLTGHSLGG